jgi:CDP-diacylglycerol--serine O-phosphatidyltransferase
MESRFPLYKHIPNLFTLFNLCSGFLSIIFLLYRNLEAAALFIIVASLFDLLDGLTARLLKATSDTGKILDSIADIVSFGVAPSAILFVIIEFSLIRTRLDFSFGTASFTDRILLFSSTIFLIASALRLAWFVLQEDTTLFLGLPTPAASIFVAGLTFILMDPFTERITEWILNLYILIPSILVMSFLMISRIRFVSFKFNQFSFSKNKWKYIFIALSAVILILLQKFAFSLIVILYIIVSIINHFLPKPSEQ